MTVTFQLPSDLEQSLRHEVQNVDAEAKEALLVELYRQGKLTHTQLSQALGLGRIETEGLRKKHHVIHDLPTTEEISEDLKNLRRLLGE